MSLAIGIGALALATWIYLVAFRAEVWRVRLDNPPMAPAVWPEVVAIVPARDEAETIGAAIGSLLSQDYGGRFTIVLVDDHSSDGTAEIARHAADGHAGRLHIIAARPLPPGWTGKLWAVSEGLAAAERVAPEARHVLLTDADIVHAPDNLAGLVARVAAGGLDLASLMVRLRCESLAERLLVPAFVFFFAMLYPFVRVNRDRDPTAAAAGGCMLVRRSALARIGGVRAIRDRLIDDCALAAAIKPGGPIWLGLADGTHSLRRYERPADIWAMVARTAYTQLRHSPVLLLGCVLAMTVTYLAPPALALAADGSAAGLGWAAWFAMSASYLPMLHYYSRSPLWAPLLPMVALFYLGATLESARQHWRGRGGQWKGRAQAVSAGPGKP
ncbi:MAG: glycosyltransferase [Alphaproteobacteria bacterium]|nr:glycosyltransferase [Alphaproteobacteria bacterium]